MICVVAALGSRAPAVESAAEAATSMRMLAGDDAAKAVLRRMRIKRIALCKHGWCLHIEWHVCTRGVFHVA